MDLTELTAFEIAAACRSRETSAEQVLAELSAAIQAADGRHKAYVRFDPKKSFRSEKPASQLLCGVPVAMKDNLCVEGQETTCASNILQGFVAPYHSTVARRLMDAGAVLFGRTNMDEFAFGSSCESSCYGPTRNPRSEDRVPGGSSGGSAAAVAARTAITALGSDTGGSIRQPAAFCGVTGLKPTYGRVSRYGLIAFASSLDQIGPITRDVRDAALVLQAIAGHDPKDSTCADVPVPDYLKALEKDCRGLRIGIPAEYWEKAGSPDLIGMRERAVKTFEGLGAKIETVSMPHTKYAVNVYYIVAPSEASSNLARFDGVRFGARDKAAPTLLQMYERTRGQGFGAEAKRRIILGTYSLSSGYYDAYYLRAMKVRTLIKRDFDEAFRKVDVLLTPTAPSAAFKVGQKTQDPLEMYLSDIFTISANLAGVPAISVPGGESSDNGLPLGLQILAKPFDEETLLRAAYGFEQAAGFNKKLGNVR